MKKVFGFIGSPLKEKSNTYTVAKMVLDKAVEMNREISYELLTAGNVHLKACRGCWSCMMKGDCPQDRKDDMGMLRQKMLDADFIVWGSPVYTHQVSGQMKIFLDRLAAWYHCLRLAGKSGMAVVTTGSTGAEEVIDYLKLMLCSTGLKVAGSIYAFAALPQHIYDWEGTLEKAGETAREIYPYIAGEKTIESDEQLEKSFLMMKSKTIFGGDTYLSADLQYWREHGMLDLNSFSELLEKINRE